MDLLYKSLCHLHTPDRNRARTARFSVLRAKCPVPLVLVFTTNHALKSIIRATHHTPLHATPKYFDGQAISGARARYSSFGGQNPAPARSVDPSLLLPQSAHQHLTRYSLHMPRPAILMGRRYRACALDIRLLGSNPAPARSVDPSLLLHQPAYQRLTRYSLYMHCPAISMGRRYRARALNICLLGPKPRPRSIH